MTDSQGSVGKKRLPRWMVAAVSVSVIAILLGVYAFYTSPGMFRPSEVRVTGTVASSGDDLETIVFTNTGCGTEYVANISMVGPGSGTYSVSLRNGYSYNVTLRWAGGEADLDVLVLESVVGSVARDWSVP